MILAFLFGSFVKLLCRNKITKFNDRGIKPKSRQLELLCFSYLQYLYQQLRSENEMGVAFRIRVVTESSDGDYFNA